MPELLYSSKTCLKARLSTEINTAALPPERKSRRLSGRVVPDSRRGLASPRDAEPREEFQQPTAGKPEAFRTGGGFAA